MATAVVRREAECELEEWDDAIRGAVSWRTLFSGDRTPTSALTMGIAELQPMEERPGRPHRHSQPEVYYILSGEGIVSVDGHASAVSAGSAVFVPGNAAHFAANTGAELMRLLYVFAADSFDEVVYEFPGEDGEFAPLP